MSEGTVRNINSGRVIGKTDNLSRTFLHAVREAQKKYGEDIAVVTGSLAHREMRQLVSEIEAMGVQVWREEVGLDVAFIVQCWGDTHASD